MARDFDDDFFIHLGRSPRRADLREQPFIKHLEAAIRKAGGNPNRISGLAGKRSGRFMPAAAAPSCRSRPRLAAGSGILPGDSGRAG